MYGQWKIGIWVLGLKELTVTVPRILHICFYHTLHSLTVSLLAKSLQLILGISATVQINFSYQQVAKGCYINLIIKNT